MFRCSLLFCDVNDTYNDNTDFSILGKVERNDVVSLSESLLIVNRVKMCTSLTLCSSKTLNGFLCLFYLFIFLSFSRRYLKFRSSQVHKGRTLKRVILVKRWMVRI